MDHHTPDMAEIRGLALGRRAVEVMAAGGHHLLLCGCPGSGLTLLANRSGALLPDPSHIEAAQLAEVYSLTGWPLPAGAPVRMPHYTASVRGLLGGGTPLVPGEVSLAHAGLLFLDDLPSFSRACIEGLRWPLEVGSVSLSPPGGSRELPARPLVMASMRPCPCGWRGHPDRACTCSPASMRRHVERLAPVIGRFDLVVPLELDPPGGPYAEHPGKSSASIRARVLLARERQGQRLAGTPWRSNADVPARGGAVDRLCRLSPEASRFLDRIAAVRGLTPADRHRVQRVARTVADLDAREWCDLDTGHVIEAVLLHRWPQIAHVDC